jgi:transcriptional regulator with XRE-family HTH domain
MNPETAAKVTAHESPLYQRIVADARKALTLQEIANTTGVQLRSVQNWAAGSTRPEGKQRDRLLELQYIVTSLADVYDNEGIEIWLHHRQRQLDHLRPIDALQQGRFESVLMLVEQLAGGPKR